MTAAVYAWVGNPFDPFDDERFSPEAWQQRGWGEPRGPMARDLVRHVLKPGMTEPQLVALLGRPDGISDRRGPGGRPFSNTHLYEYSIGHSEWLSMDDAFIYVYLDLQERVVRAEIYGY